MTTEIDGTAYLAAKTAAIRAHATQIAVDGDRFALADGRWQPVLGKEFYTLLAWGALHSPGHPGPRWPWNPPGRRWRLAGKPGQAPSRELAGPPGAAHGTTEHDLFAGLDGR